MTDMKPVCKVVNTKEELGDAHSIRREVFIIQQGVPEHIEMDEHDADALHVLCRVDGSPVGTGRIEILKDGVKIGRVAVLEPYRGQGVGRFIVRFLILEASARSRGKIYANVQLEVVEFYRKLGFIGQGEIFLEAGIEHMRMVLEG